MKKKDSNIQWMIASVAIAIILIFATVCTGYNDDNAAGTGIQSEERTCVGGGDEPPINPYLADSPWPMCHRNPYQQASSPYKGPSKGMPDENFSYLKGMPGVITTVFSPGYPDGSRVIWAGNQRVVFKAGFKDKSLIDLAKITKQGFRWRDILNPDVGISGAYTILDKDNIFYVPRFTRLYAYGDITKGDPDSEIEMKRCFEIPRDRLVDEEEMIIGINMSWDGMIAMVTDNGLVCVVSRAFDQAFYFRFSRDEDISNSIAVDENGGIYVVTSKKMYRVQWTGNSLTTSEDQGGWVADYETGGDTSGIRLGQGSGATPTLMGTGDQDRLVVITDGQKLMNLVFFWRDDIPGDWKQIPGTKDRRIAAQIPVTFGDKETKQSSSEQSVCARGYGALVVNNQLNIDTESRFWAILRSGDPDVAPYGAEKFVWNPEERSLTSVWANREISFPNGIPSMSAATNLVYNVGQRDGIWTFEALDWDTGKSVFHYDMGKFWYNSTWAATVIGPYGTLNSGAATGIMSVFPDEK
ncbi:MAG: hypothetical protein JRC53_00095 [Deltaproteobacteria bacterium]|nr:hypothetical protein [Deltaproteobacteria bacterium]